MSKVETNTIDTISGSATMQIGSTNTSTINIGASGDTVNIPSGVTIANAGTATGFGDMTPSFLAHGTSDQSSLSDNTETKRIFNSEIYDTDNAYDTSTGLFTAPSAGKYFLYAIQNVDGGGSSVGSTFTIGLSHNSSSDGTALTFYKFNSTDADANRFDINVMGIKDLSANDTVGVYCRLDTDGGSWNMYGTGNGRYSQFGGFKIIT